VGDISTQLLLEIEAAKETLSFDAKAGLNVLDGQTGKLYAADYERSTFEDLLTDRGLFNRLQAVLRAALRDAEDKGVDQEAVSQWLLVGGSTLIPAVRRTLQAQFGERLAYQKPFTSVALGACRFAAEGELIEWIQHDYAIRHYDKDRQTDDFRKLVKRGTPYPSDGPVARLPVSGVYDKQRELGIDIYELGDERTSAVGEVISFDQNGRVRKTKLRGGNHHFWINEHQRTFLEADPPANQDQHRFDLTFTVDGNKRLLMTAMDVVTRRLVYRDFPVAKLK
jgi:molecular chaperone DnaK (HSP70)